MILIELTYQAPLDLIDAHLVEHGRFLNENYENGNFILSGRKAPRTGGIIFTRLKTIEEASMVITNDPFFIHQLAEYRFIHFIPSKYQKGLEAFL